MRSTAITSALITYLWADAALKALVPDGVFRNIAGKSLAHNGTSKRFVVVSRIIGRNRRVFEGVAYQASFYLIEARMLSTAGGNINAAAERLDELLVPPGSVAALTIPGWHLMGLYQDEPIEEDEFDAADPSIIWNRAGGRYGLWAAPLVS